MSRYRAFARLFIALTVAAVVAVGCTTPPKPGTTQADPDFVPTFGWWAAGDSIFSGSSNYLGTPRYLEDVLNIAVGGRTLVPVTILAAPQPTIRGHILGRLGAYGVPEKMVIHGGGADLFAKQVWQASISYERIMEEIVSLDAWLTGLGIEVWWTTIAPHASWGTVAPQNAFRLKVNDGLRELLPERLIDCEATLIDPANNTWLNAAYQIPHDGVHLNGAGALAQARCISERTGIPIASWVEGGAPPAPDPGGDPVDEDPVDGDPTDAGNPAEGGEPASEAPDVEPTGAPVG